MGIEEEIEMYAPYNVYEEGRLNLTLNINIGKRTVPVIVETFYKYTERKEGKTKHSNFSIYPISLLAKGEYWHESNMAISIFLRRQDLFYDELYKLAQKQFKEIKNMKR